MIRVIANRKCEVIAFVGLFLWTIVTGLDTPESYVEENLRLHNLLRLRHNGPGYELIIDEQLSKKAEEWAKSIGDAADENGVSSAVSRPAYDNNNPRYGDNIGGLDAQVLASFPGLENDGGYPVRQWYREIFFHNFRLGRNKFTPETSHFSQLVWKETALLGVGRHITPKGHLIVVCIYMPPGNDDYYSAFMRHVIDQPPPSPPLTWWDSWVDDKEIVKYLDNGGESLFPPTPLL